ncbi:MAG: scyllo-inositol 2-dehydrogenase (NAD(+)) [Alphaproteobacteria bacterium MarineAlpha3_Bin5]|nr:hypothetical protein [Magnetovibrio sp.]PPR79871.1 MAG: scyllo-inositol 2-dehydrogenase (NAD(+)) [Alphaproteobacteria bacterium MarineAlpha3_Bin5]
MKCGVLGLGSIGRRHAENLLLEGCEVNAYDPCEKRTRDICKLGLKIFSCRDQVIDQSEAIIVASPNEYHFQDLDAAVKAGRHVFVEKPLTHSVKGMKRLLSKAMDNRLIIFAGLNLRFHPAVSETRKIILEGELGKIHWVRSISSSYLPDWRPSQDYRSGYVSKPKTGGVIFDVIHEIDLAGYLFGTPEVVCATAKTSGYLEIFSDDIADIMLRHPTGLITALHMDLITKPPMRITEISGDKGLLTMDLAGRHLKLTNRDGNIIADKVYHTSWDDDYRNEISAFLSVINGADIPYCNGAEAFEIIKIAIAARRLAGLPSCA